MRRCFYDLIKRGLLKFCSSSIFFRKELRSPIAAMSDTVEPPASSSPSAARDPASLIHPRREPFEHGLLPIPKLIFTDPTQTLIPLKQRLVEHYSPSQRVNSAAISEALQISIEHARLVLDTIASILHSEADPLVRAKHDGEVDSVGVDVRDLVLFLYIQSYKRLLPRTHKDAAAVADVWPSTSAFDGYLSALSPLQVICTHSLTTSNFVSNLGTVLLNVGDTNTVLLLSPPLVSLPIKECEAPATYIHFDSSHFFPF